MQVYVGLACHSPPVCSPSSPSSCGVPRTTPRAFLFYSILFYTRRSNLNDTNKHPQLTLSTWQNRKVRLCCD